MLGRLFEGRGGRLCLGQRSGNLFVQRLQAIIGQVLLDQRQRLLTKILNAPFRDGVPATACFVQRDDADFVQLGLIEVGLGQMIEISPSSRCVDWRHRPS